MASASDLPTTKESGNERLTARLRDVDEPNALIIRREAADLIDLYEATIVAVVEKEQAALAERDALREAIRHVVNDSLGTPASVKDYLSKAWAAALEHPE